MRKLVGTLVRVVASLGRTTTDHASGIALLVWQTASALTRGRVARRDVLGQLYAGGVQSLPLVVVTGSLSGIVTSQQSGYQFTGSVPMYFIGMIVALNVILELSPVLTAVVVIGRVGARITAELGTMQVSEQIDAIQALGRDPIPVLAAPRILAGVIAMPLLVAIANGLGLLAGMIAAQISVGLGNEAFLFGARMFWDSWYFFYSEAKALVFGFVIPVIAVHMGLRTRGGAEGVGRATTAAVVFMIITVLILDALFPPILLG
jgi:phospholipid/cholesterol/gamma-HCH transport system permease protein